MASKIWGSAGFSLANWRPAKDQLRQMLEGMHVHVFDIREEANPFGGSRLKVYLETAGLALTDLFDALELAHLRTYSNSAPVAPRLLAFSETMRWVASSKPLAFSARTSR